MKAARDPLLRHLAVVVALKLLVLTGLWWAFIREERVSVDVESAAAQLGAVADVSPADDAFHGVKP